ncbi:MAG: hypothetical protein ACOYD0_09075 [Candidatus Nanopelagicales bacterium]
MATAFDWLFRNRKTGGITIGQFPNLPLAIFLAALVAGWLLEALDAGQGTLRTVVDAIGTVALAWWALEELIRGVNPWRRMLGAGALVLIAIGLISRF